MKIGQRTKQVDYSRCVYSKCKNIERIIVIWFLFQYISPFPPLKSRSFVCISTCTEARPHTLHTHIGMCHVKISANEHHLRHTRQPNEITIEPLPKAFCFVLSDLNAQNDGTIYKKKKTKADTIANVYDSKCMYGSFETNS